MPLIAPPARGFADMQRTSPYDSGVLYTDTNRSMASNITTAIFDVSRYAYLAGFDNVGGGQGQVDIQWFSDSLGANQVAQRQFVLDSSHVSSSAQYRLPNLGPFVQLQWSFVAGSPSHSSIIFATNRFHPCEFIPFNPVIINQQVVTLPASGTVTSYPTDYFSGPVWVNIQASQIYNVRIQQLDFLDNWNNIYGLNNVAANVLTEFSTIMPAGAWRVNVTNTTSTAGTVTVTVVPSLTGSS